MSLPFDLEDVIGVALADTLRRVAFLMVVVFGGSLVGAFAVHMGEFVAWRVETGNWSMEFWEFSLWRTMLIPLRPVFSMWGFLYLPLMVAVAFYFGKAAVPGIRGAAVFMTLVGFFAVVGRGEPGWFNPTYYGIFIGPTVVSDPDKLYRIMMAVGLVMWLGISGSFWFVAIFCERRQRLKAEVHFMGVEFQNRMKREEIARRTGGAVADREYAVGEEPKDWQSGG